MPMTIQLAPELQGILAVGIVRVTGLHVRAENPHWHLIDELCRTYHQQYAGAPSSQVPDVGWARKLYASVGIDPTRYRPSSEALLRRALKGEPLPQINTLVDACNWCSLDYLLPIGLHDTDRLIGDVTLRLGLPEEAYEGIRKGMVHVAGRLCASDGYGAFGSPSSDSLRASIMPATRNALALLYAPADYPEEDLAEATEMFAERATAWCGGEVVLTDVLR